MDRNGVDVISNANIRNEEVMMALKVSMDPGLDRTEAKPGQNSHPRAVSV
jgi:hypothetical protein